MFPVDHNKDDQIINENRKNPLSYFRNFIMFHQLDITEDIQTIYYQHFDPQFAISNYITSLPKFMEVFF